MSAFRPRKGGDRLLLQRTAHTADQAQVRLFRARQLLLRHRVNAQAAVGLSLIAQALACRDKRKAARREQKMLQFRGPQRAAADDAVLPRAERAAARS